jgi:hypothetical protein
MPEVASGPSKMVKSLSGGKDEFVDRTLPYVCLSDGKHDIVNRTLPYVCRQAYLVCPRGSAQTADSERITDYL